MKTDSYPYSEFVMPFGRHKGLRLSLIPSSYLSFLMRDLSPSPSNDEIKRQIKAYRKSIKKKVINCK